ncbi:MAG TPA: class E sortase [Actinomycetaceae bacterium]|nr:class E sortase [Actinomycetaceae bacterium]
MATTDTRERIGSAGPPRRRRRKPRRGFVAGFIGVLGELLITLGLLLGLFIVWQLWWTDVEAHRYQATVLDQWQREPDYVEAPPQVAERRTDAPPVPDDRSQGEVMATLHIPRLGPDYNVSIAHGIGMDTVLNRGYIGHYPETQLPGEVGNFATAAHRQSYGAPYRRIDEIRHGDELIVETADAYLVYAVTDDEIVLPSQVEVLAPVPNRPGEQAEERYLTLTTCHPLFSAAQRWITYAEFEYWIDKNDGQPEALIAGGD